MVLSPRVPEYVMSGEDEDMERICAAPTIMGCINAILLPIGVNDKNIFEYYEIFNIEKQEYPVWVYAANVPCKDIIQPTEKDLPDVFITGELWITNTCEFTKVNKYYLGLLDDTNFGDYTSKYYLRREDYGKPINTKSDMIFMGSSSSFGFLRQHVSDKEEILKRLKEKENKEGE